jgi:hypothetical protein
MPIEREYIYIYKINNESERRERRMEESDKEVEERQVLYRQ